MSGVYIPGMEMPEKCEKCDLCFLIKGEHFCQFLYEPVNFEIEAGKRSEYCLLIPVPDHGRLIDADALCMKLKMMYAQAFADGNSAYHSAYRSLEKVVNAAPTIIPASGKKEDE